MLAGCAGENYGVETALDFTDSVAEVSDETVVPETEKDAPEPTAEQTPEPMPEQTPEPTPEPMPESTPEPIQEPASAPVPEVAPDSSGGGTGTYAVNGKNGKVHIVGQCSATGNGEHAMDYPVYFNTYDEAIAYSEMIKPGLEKRQCGNCW